MPLNYGYNRDSVGALNLYGRPATGISRHVNGVGVDSNGNAYYAYTNTTVATVRRAGLLWTVDGALVITYTDPGNTRVINGFKVSAAGAVFVTTDTPTTTSRVTFDPILGSLLVSAAGAVHIQENWQSAPGSLLPNGFSLTRASTGTYFDSAGLLQTAAIDATRGTYRYNGSAWVFDGTLVESAATQLVTPTASIRDLTNAAWTKTNMTTAKTSVGADGAANSATRCTATAGNATVLQTLVAAASSRTVSFLIRRVTGTGNIELTQDGATYTNIATQLNSSVYTLVQLNASQLNASFGIRIVTNGDAIDVDFAQFEAGSGATSRIATAGATRSADVLTAPVSGLLVNAQGFAAIGYKVIAPNATNADQGVQISTFDGAAGGIPLYTFGGTIKLFDGTTAVVGPANTLTVGASYKNASTWSGSSSAIAQNGSVVSGLAFDGSMNFGATVRIGAHADGSVAMSMVLQSLRLGKKQATSAELSEFTA